MDSKNNSEHSEREFAGEIKQVLNHVGNDKLSPLAKDELWEKIAGRSVNRSIFYNWKLYVQVAAILFVVSGIGIWLYQQNTPTHKLLDFAATELSKKNGADQQQALKPNAGASAVSSAHEAENITTTNDFNTLVVGNGQRSVIELPDGTKVWLNSGSR